MTGGAVCAESKLFPTEFTGSIIHDMKNPISFAFASYIYENAFTFPEVERLQIVYTRFVSAGMQRQAVINIPTYDKWLEKMSTAATTEKDKAPAKDKLASEKDKAPAKDKPAPEKDKKTENKTDK